MFQVRPFKIEDSDTVTTVVLSLEKFYPTIKNWWFGSGDKKGQLDKIERGEVFCLVAEQDSVLAGVSVFGWENSQAGKTIKLKTFKINDEFQGQGIGAFLFDETMSKIFSLKPEKVFVTFAEEEVEELSPFFSKYGFQLEAAVLGQYRQGKVEYYMSKLQFYGEIGENEFIDFIKRSYLQNRGFVIKKEIDDKTLMVKNLSGLAGITEATVQFNLSVNPTFNGDANAICFSFYSPETKPINPTVIDGHDIEHLFYPLTLLRKSEAGFVAPVNPEYSMQLFPDSKQASLAPLRRSLRSDKIFFKSTQVRAGIKRGAVFVFYETNPAKSIVGEARVSGVEVGESQALYKKYKQKGVVSEEDIRNWGSPESGDIQAIYLDRWIKYPKSLNAAQIEKIIPKFNPQGTRELTQDKIQQIRRAAGYYD
jgi:predicted transcriptional regulator